MCSPLRPRSTFAARFLPLSFLVLCHVVPGPLGAQSTFAGVVTDPAGEPVAGATVTVTRLLREAMNRFKTETNADGKYVLENFNPAKAYRFRVEKQGYRPAERDVEVGGQRIEMGSVFRQSFTLYPEGSAYGDDERQHLLMLDRYSPAIDHYKKGVKALDRGDLEKARSRFEQGRKVDSDFVPIHEGLALTYHRLGMPAEAAQSADRVLEERLMDPTYLRILYESYRELGEVDQARQVLLTLSEASSNPATGRLFFNEGVKAANQRDFELAASMFQAALRLAPELVEARVSLAKVYVQSRKFESAAAYAEELLASDPTNPDLLKIRHQAYTGLGDMERALATLDALIEHDPGPRTATLLYNEGVKAFNAGDDATAEQIFDKAFALDPENLQVRIGLAQIYLEQHKFEEALIAVNEVLDRDPDSAAGRRIRERTLVRMRTE